MILILFFCREKRRAAMKDEVFSKNGVEAEETYTRTLTAL